MKYIEVRDLIKRELYKNPEGLTWKQLREQLDLPYETLCPEWTMQLESEIGLRRQSGSSRSFVWSLNQNKRL